MLSGITIGQLPPKKSQVKLPIFCGNAKQVMTIYGEIYQTTSEGTSFAQKGGSSNKYLNPNDKQF